MNISHTLSTYKQYVSVSIVVLAMTLFLAGCPSPNGSEPMPSEKQTVTITSTSAMIYEGSAIDITLERDMSAGDLTVQLDIKGNAESVSDYETLSDTVTFKNGEDTATITLTAGNDRTKEEEENVIITIEPSDAYTVGDHDTVTITIIDQAAEGSPTISISAITSEVNEGENITITVRSNIPVTGELTVSFTIDEESTKSAQQGDDYELDPAGNTVTITDEKKSATITIRVYDDDNHEEDETIVMSIDPSSNYHINGGERSATVTILNDDLPTVGFRATSQTLHEGDDEGVTIILERSNDEVRDPLTVQLTIEGTATIDEDYELPGVTTNTLDGTVTATVTIPGGDTKAMVTIEATDDSIHELAEDLTITIDSATRDYSVLTGTGTVTVTITDDDLPTVSIGRDTSISEGGQATLTLTRSNDEVLAPLEVQLSFDGTAESGDYTGLTTTANFGEDSDEITITLTAVNDDIHEVAETVVITIIDSDAYTVGDSSTVTVTITDDDLPTVSIGRDTSISEGGQATLTLTRSNDKVLAPLKVQLSFAGSTANEGEDYTGLTTTASFREGSDEVTITLTAEDNDIREATETVVITIIEMPGAYTVGDSRTATVTITDDDLPTVGFRTASQRLDEGNAESVTVTVGRSNDEVLLPLEVQLSFAGNTTEGVDFEKITTSITIPHTKASVEFTLQLYDDKAPEGNEEVIITISEMPNAYTIDEENRKVTITIVDDEDTDGDMIPNSVDVDDDNNGLIEIHTLEMLRNVHFNLAGTSYDDEDDDSLGNAGDSTGCPSDGCNGYELTRNLDFSNAGSYATDIIKEEWRPNVAGNSNDATNEGFPGIGAVSGTSGGFTGTFEGNGHSILNLYMRNTARQGYNTGLFRRTDTGAKIRNLGMMNVAIYGGAGNNDNVGGLVGYNNEGDIIDIIASYATGTVDGGAGNNDNVGGLVGQNYGTITASYATGTVDGGDGNSDSVGGLVGYNDIGRITASYATGTVDGGDGTFDNVGGLVGQNYGTITASYATGTVDGGDGDSDAVGGLVGYNDKGDITASYATGDGDGGAGDSDAVGGLVGYDFNGDITASYGFGTTVGSGGSDGDPKPTLSDGTSITMASQLSQPGSAANETTAPAGSSWNAADSQTLGTWDFGTSGQNPALKYADYDDAGTTYSCDHFSATIPGTDTPLVCGPTLLPGQRD